MMWAMPAPQSTNALERLAAHVTQRRVELGMPKSAVAAAAKITVKTYDKIEQAEPVRDVTYGKVDPVLGWAIGSCRDILRGGSPTILEKTSVNGGVISPVAPGDLESDIEQAVQGAAIALEGADLSASDIRKLKQHVVEELRRRGKLPDSSGD